MDANPTPIHLQLPPTSRARLTTTVKRLALACGLQISGITSADAFPGLADLLVDRVRAGHLAGLDWFTEERARFSSDPRNVQSSARSIIAVALTYWPGSTDKPDDGVPRGRISRYAWGRDYHKVLKRRLRNLHEAIEREVGHPVEVRNLADTARIVDRAVAARAGVGWYGKHAGIIVPGYGSWVMLGELLVDLDLEPDEPLTHTCGRCMICLDRCPTGAIVAPYTIHAPRCISFLTIELRNSIPNELRSPMGDWVYGCDVCQEVCPYTTAAKAAQDPEMRPASLDNAYPSLPWLLTMTAREFGATYFGTPVPRTKRRGLARNAAVALGNIGTEDDIPTLAHALHAHDEPLVRGHAAWAIGHIGGTTARRALDVAHRVEPDDYVQSEIVAALESSG